MLTDAHVCDLESTVEDLKRKQADEQVNFSLLLY
jgi:hypothetical protein